jgi:flavin reductase (DIM6/NTAB) family NADH-FMN oxidoreductase RutF
MRGECMMGVEGTDNPMAVDPEEFRKAMRQWATGVAVVTAVYQDIRHGMTVNSFISISLDPPLVLVSLEHQTRTYHLVEQSGSYGVTILAQEQQEISDCFAGRHTEIENRFSNVPTYDLVTGAPFIEGGLASFDCRVVSKYDAGTHTLFIGEVVALKINSSPVGGGSFPGDPPPEEGDHPGYHDPLIYYNRAYRRLQL